MIDWMKKSIFVFLRDSILTNRRNAETESTGKSGRSRKWLIRSVTRQFDQKVAQMFQKVAQMFQKVAQMRKK